MQTHGIAINRKSKTRLKKQVESAFRTAILSGTLAARERVLSTRELQTHLGLSRDTVLNAFEQLFAEGYFVTRRGVGTFVALQIHAIVKPSARYSRKPVVPSATAQRHMDAAQPAVPFAGRLPAFRPCTPALDEFPARLFSRIISSVKMTPSLLDYSEMFGLATLRTATARRLQLTRGVVCSPEQIVITDGA